MVSPRGERRLVEPNVRELEPHQRIAETPCRASTGSVSAATVYAPVVFFLDLSISA
jgi:hypothetical protein